MGFEYPRAEGARVPIGGLNPVLTRFESHFGARNLPDVGEEDTEEEEGVSACTPCQAVEDQVPGCAEGTQIC